MINSSPKLSTNHRLRQRLAQRDGRECIWCGSETVDGSGERGQSLPAFRATVEHLLPRADNDSKSLSALALACYSCNQERKTLPPHFYARLQFSRGFHPRLNLIHQRIQLMDQSLCYNDTVLEWQREELLHWPISLTPPTQSEILSLTGDLSQLGSYLNGILHLSFDPSLLMRFLSRESEEDWARNRITGEPPFQGLDQLRHWVTIQGSAADGLCVRRRIQNLFAAA